MKFKITRKCRKSSPKVTIKPTNQLISSQTGLLPISRFMEMLDFSDKASKSLNVQQGKNRLYKAHQLIELLMVICAGARSVDNVVSVWADAVLQLTSGWSSIPHATVIGKTLKKFNFSNVAEMESLVHTLRASAWAKAGFKEEILMVDVDSTQKNTFGNQEGAKKGYNTKKKGAKSYNPQLAFCAQSKEVLQGWLRSGNTYTSNGTVEFLKQLQAGLGDQKIFFRADSGYFDGKILQWLEEQGHEYLVKVKLKGLTDLLDAQEWSSIESQSGWAQSSFKYKCEKWDEPRTFVAVRQKAKEQDENLLGLVKYDYFCYVTSDNRSPWEIHKKYGERATCETWIEEAKNQMALAHIKSNSFEATSALFQCSIIAYNLLRWMALCSDSKVLKRQGYPEYNYNLLYLSYLYNITEFFWFF